jgi:hypothetical protein
VVTDPEAAELDVRTRSVTPLAKYPVSAIPFRSVKPERGLYTEPFFTLRLSPDLSRVLVLASGAACSVRLLDATTGSVLSSFDGPEEAGLPSAFFLADGSAVVVSWEPDRRGLVILSPAGERVAEIDLGTSVSRFIWVAHEPSPGFLAVGLPPEPRTDGELRWFLADLEGGRLSPVPVRLLARSPSYGPDSVPPPGSPATRLAHEKGTGRLVLYDPATGATKPLTRGGPARK